MQEEEGEVSVCAREEGVGSTLLEKVAIAHQHCSVTLQRQGKANPKIHMEASKTPSIQSTPEKQNKLDRDSGILEIKLYYRSIVTKADM